MLEDPTTIGGILGLIATALGSGWYGSKAHGRVQVTTAAAAETLDVGKMRTELTELQAVVAALTKARADEERDERFDAAVDAKVEAALKKRATPDDPPASSSTRLTQPHTMRSSR